MKYIIGVDGGGTKTEACAFSLDGKIINTSFSGFGNVLVDPKKAINNIIEAINNCKKDLNFNDCLYIYLGLAGIESGLHKTDLEKELKKFNIPFTIVNDARIAHAAMLKGEDGILTIAGTGSISYGIKKQIGFMSGGWGNLLGDEGSGYWIAIEAFKEMINDYEDLKPCSLLSKEILKYLKLNNVNDIKKFIYSSSKDEIASIVPIIVDFSKTNDLIAKRILVDAGRHLGIMSLRLCSKMELVNPSIAIKGSVLTNIDLVKESFIKTINNKINNVTFIFNQETATIGAYYLALKELEK